MAISLVQTGSEGRQVGVTTVTSVFSTNPVVGNKVIVVAAMWNTTAGVTGSVADNYGNTYTRRSFISNTDNGRLEIWEADVGTTGSTFTVTLTASLSNSEMNCVAQEYSGLGAFDQQTTASNAAAGTSLSIGPTGTLATAESLAISMVTELGNSNANYAISGWTTIKIQNDSSVVYSYGSASLTTSSTAAVTATWTFTNQTDRAGILAVFSETPPAVVAPGPILQPVGNQPPGGTRGATVAHAEAAPVLDATSATVGAIYVATTGNDTTGTGTLANPYATVGKASTVVAAGQHILMRGGTYSGAQVQFSGPGTPSQPIVLQPYNNETVIIDGTGTPAATDLLAVGGTYCIVRGLQVRNATQSGIALWQTVGCVVERCTIYNCQQSAIWIGTDTPGTSHHNTVRWNTAYNCGLVNASEALGGGGGWPSIIKFEISDNFECVYNTVYESWGEGIGADSCSTGGLIAYNTVRDCYSVLIYLDNTARTIVTGNVLSGINSAWYKLGAQTDSILVANESVSPVQIASDNLQVTGNFITGKHTAQWTGGGGTYQTLSNSALDPNFYLAALAESGSAADTQSQTLSGGGGATYNESTAETGSASDTPAATLVRVGAVAETGTAADTPAAALVAVGETAEAGSAADTPSAASVRAGAAAEAGSAVDTPATALVAVGAAAETGSAADTPAASTVRVGAVAETGSAADTSDFSVGGVSATAETLSAADTSSALIVGAGATAETGSASDTPAATAIRVGAAAETGAASDTPAAAAVRAGAVAETAAATDTPAASQVAAGSVAESLAALDTSDGAGGAVLSVAESGSASDTTSATLVRATTVAETGSAADTPAVTAVRAGAVTETGAATDTAAATAAMGGAVAETMSGFDTLLAILASANAVAESGSASDTVEALAAFIPVSTIVYLLGVIEELAELRGFIDRTAELRGNLDPDVELIGTSFNP